jgi:hypothetical protein
MEEDEDAVSARYGTLHRLCAGCPEEAIVMGFSLVFSLESPSGLWQSAGIVGA